MKTNPYDLNAMAERRRRAEAKMGKCPTCGHNPATDHLKMQEELAQAEEREKVANECIRLLEAERNTEKARADKAEARLDSILNKEIGPKESELRREPSSSCPICKSHEIAYWYYRPKGSKIICLRCGWGTKLTAEERIGRIACRLERAEEREKRLREVCRDMVDALRFIRDHDSRGLIAQHGDALEAGLAAIRLAASEKGGGECPKPA